MTCNTSISSAAGLSSAFVATVGCGSPPETPTIWGTPPIPPYRFPADTKPHTSAESCFPLLGNIYPPKPDFPLQCLFGGSTSPSCSSLGEGGVQPVSHTSPCPAVPGTARGWDPPLPSPGKGLAEPFHRLPAHNPAFVSVCQAMGSCFGRETCLQHRRD